MKNYLIIGGNSGIGKATIQSLEGQDCQIYAALRNVDEVHGLNAQFFDALSPAELVLPDVLDGLVYCPGSINLKPFHRLSEEDFLQDYQVNALGAVRVIQQALPSLKKASSASVVLFSTVAVQTGMPYHASVGMAKGAIEGLMRSLAAEFAPQMRVNAIAPSLTDTSLAESLLNSEAKRESSAKRHPLNRIGKPEEVAELVSFLLSDASKFMTGQVLNLDGGLSSVKTF